MNCEPSVCMSSGAQRGASHKPFASSRRIELVPCRAYQRPPDSTQRRRVSCAASEGPAKAVNGTVNGGATDKWCSADGAVKSMEVDLGAQVKLTKLTVRHAGAGGESASLNTKAFTLETSQGGGVWTTAATITGNTASVTNSTVSVTARWIRISTTDPIARIYEFEAY